MIHALAGHGDDVVLVGHSLAGCVLPVVASQRPLSRVVFLCAIIPEPGACSATSQPSSWTTTSRRSRRRSRPPTTTAGGATEPRVDHRVDVRRLPARGLPVGLRTDAAAIDGSADRTVPRRRVVRVPADVVVCTEDRMAPPDWLRSKANDHLGVKALELAGSH